MFLFIILYLCRSGSSFTGDLLSASSTVFYVFEPFHGVKVNGVGIEKALSDIPSLYPIAQQRLENLFDCNLTSKEIKKMQHIFHGIRKRGLNCLNSSPRVVKTIRIRRPVLEPWINNTDIKVAVCC